MMMRVFSSILLGGLSMTIVLGTPAVAKPPPAVVWEQFHFKDAKGQMHTVTDQVQIPRADYAERECGSIATRVGVGLLHLETSKHPEVANMTFVSADCATDKSGNLKIAVAGSPGPKATAASNAAGAAPADMVVHFIASNDTRVNILMDHEKGQPLFTMSTCAIRVKQDLSALLRKMQADHERSVQMGNLEPYDVRSLKFVGATCAPHS
jgi:hypothetical protein